MRHVLSLSVLTLALAASAQASIIGVSTGTPSGGMRIVGFGDTGPSIFPSPPDGKGVVSWLAGYQNCSAAGSLQTCTLSGNYLDTGTQSTPGGGGAFSFETRYDSAEVAGLPVPNLGVIQSSIPDNDPNSLYNNFTLLAQGQSVLFTLRLTPSGGGPQIVRYFGFQTPTNFLTDFGFNFSFIDSMCTGLAANAGCGVGNVSLTPQATIAGSTTFSFDFPNLPAPPSVPEPATLALMLVGLAAVAAKRRSIAAN